MKIEVLPLNQLKPYANNAKIHTPTQVAQIASSIQELGFNDPIAVDENNMIIEGHGRYLALQSLGWTDVECIRLAGLTEEQKRAYIHIHNQLTMNTGFDLDILEQELKSIEGIDMEFFGFDMDFEIDSDFDFDDGESAAASQAAAAANNPRAELGQLWQLGRHRLMVGDSTSKRDVDKLTGGEAMDLCVTDPPYNVALGQKDFNTYEARKRHRRTDGLVIMNDSMEDDEFHDFLVAFYSQMLRVLVSGGSYYIFHADSEGLNFRAALQDAGGQIRQNLIWVKNAMTLGRQDYQWKHEPILYGWKEGAGHYFVNDRCQTTVFENRPDLASLNREELAALAEQLLARLDAIPSSIIKEDRPTRSVLHPTMKPVALCAKLIQNSSKRGDKVIDFFGGSGSTLMACEETGRTCYAMELDPKYANVILTRWEEATGEKAVLLNGV